MDANSTVHFMSSLIKSIQGVCYGHVDFLAKVEVKGHLIVSVDSCEEYDYILNEKVCRNPRESSLKFVSKSFHAEPPKKPKPTTDSACNTDDVFEDSSSPPVPPEFASAESDVALMQREESLAESQSISPKSSPRPLSPCLHSSTSVSAGTEKKPPVTDSLPPLHSVTFSEVPERNLTHSFSMPPHQEHVHSSSSAQEGACFPPRTLPSLHQFSSGTQKLAGPSSSKRPRTVSLSHPDTSLSLSTASASDVGVTVSETQSMARDPKGSSEPQHRKQPQRSRSERDDFPVDIDLTLVKQEIEEAAQGLCLESGDNPSFGQAATSTSSMSDLYQWNLPVHFQQSNGADTGGGTVPSFHNPSLLPESGRPPGDLSMDNPLYPIMLHSNPRASSSQEELQSRLAMPVPGPGLGPPPSMPGPSQGFPRGSSGIRSRRCQTLSLRKKVELLDQIKQYPWATHRQLVKIFGIPKTTIQRVMRQEHFLRQCLAQTNRGELGSGVRPGKVPHDIAQANSMVELTPGSGVYLYPHQLHRARFRQSGTSCANYLLKCFYTTTELLGSNLTGVNNKKLLDPQIISSIIAFSSSAYNEPNTAKLRQALRARITAEESYYNRKVARVESRNNSHPYPASKPS